MRKKKIKKAKKSSLFAEFKAFISKGSALELAIGVIIASAFTAIVNSIVNGIFNPVISLVFSSLGVSTDGIGWVLNWWNPNVWANLDTATNVGNCFNGRYNKDYAIYFDLGTFINAVLYFLIVAIILFTILKTSKTLKARKERTEKERLEKYYEEHPEERPKPAPEEPKKPTEVELLAEIRDQLKELNKEKETK